MTNRWCTNIWSFVTKICIWMANSKKKSNSWRNKSL